MILIIFVFYTHKINACQLYDFVCIMLRCESIYHEEFSVLGFYTSGYFLLILFMIVLSIMYPTLHATLGLTI